LVRICSTSLEPSGGIDPFGQSSSTYVGYSTAV
jgi:hypothetical protein